MLTRKTLQFTIGLDPLYAQRFRDVAAREGLTPREWLESRLSRALDPENANDLRFYLVALNADDAALLDDLAKVRGSDPDAELDLLLCRALEAL